ncbi:hypothetical protein WKI68_05560 [Streptomyces sp. MS1.HAVA.3]|uniref:Uncharacterized protein n=1 Tax=Streptomyces caledonius TaxID=3134107 RepID=A0ABU8TZP8_9ACTN
MGNTFRDRPQGGKHFAPSSPAALLSERDWQPADRQPGAHYPLSPDGHAAYRIRIGRLHEYDELMDPSSPHGDSPGARIPSARRPGRRTSAPARPST